MDRLTRAISRAAQIVMVFMAILPLGGCLATQFRHPANHSLWHARLPKEPGFNGVVFVLQEPPKTDFAFLLAQRYPNSYVVVRPNFKDRSSQYISKESMISYEQSQVRSGDRIRRWSSWGRSCREIPVTEIALESTLVFHQMKLVSCNQVPAPLVDGASITLAWAQKERLPAVRRGDRSDWSDICGSLLVGAPFFLTFGSLWPPPISNSPYWKYSLNVQAEPGGDFQIESRKNADAEFISGGIWFLPLYPFLNEDSHDLFQEPDQFSPGGWANCLEQLFRDKRVQQVAEAGTLTSEAARQDAFDKLYEVDGYDLKPLPYWNPYLLPKELYLVPRNPVVNPFLTWNSTVGLPVPAIMFGKAKWPNVCYLKHKQDPEAPVYLWRNSENDKNWLVTALERSDEVIKKDGPRYAY